MAMVDDMVVGLEIGVFTEKDLEEKTRELLKYIRCKGGLSSSPRTQVRHT